MFASDLHRMPEDWRPHVNVVRDRVSLRCQGDHFLTVAFLYEDGDERDAINVTLAARNGEPFAQIEQSARAELLERAKSRAGHR